jgi:glycosyltransferase involved in cell wall biosynthesis
MSLGDTPFVSVVLPVRNGERTIGDCLASILAADYPLDRREVVVVDNASTDRTAEIINRYPVRYVYEARRGRSAARNRGIKESRGEILAFIDSDCVATTRWLRELAAGFAENGVCGVAGEIVAFPPTTVAERYYARTRARPQGSAVSKDRPYAVTANVAFRKETFDRIGVFDPRFRSGQDVDLGWRLHDAGLKLVYRERALVLHRHRPTGWGLFRQYFFRAQGWAFLHQKHDLPWSIGQESRQYGKLLAAVGRFGQAALGYGRRGKDRLELHYAYYEVVRKLAVRLGTLYGLVHRLPVDGSARHPLRAGPPAPRAIGRSRTPALPRLGPDERRLMLVCARVALTEQETAEVAALLRRPLDWSAVLFFARLHSVTPLLHRHLRDLDEGPREVKRELLKQHQRAGYQNRLFAREHARLVDAFNAAGVPILVPKGLSVAELAYGSLSSRPLLDLIYLVSASDLSRAADVLREEGYEPRRIRPREAVYRWSCPQFVFKRRAEDLAIVVVAQSTLVTWPRLHRYDADRFWSEARLASVGGRDVLIPSPVDQILYLCLQADNHGLFNRAAIQAVDPVDLLFSPWSNNRLIRFVDILETIRDERAIDWGRVIDGAREAMLGEAVHASLLLTNRLLGPIVPRDVIEALQPMVRSRVRSWLADGLSGDHSATPAQRFIASRWEGIGPRKQVRLARLMGLAEMAAPTPRTLEAIANSHGNARLLVRYVQHTGRVLVRAGSDFLRASVDGGRARRAGTQKR